MIKTNICEICGKEYMGYHNSKFCKKCIKKSHCINVSNHYHKIFGKSRRIRICKECNKKYEIDANAQKYCKVCAPIVRRRNSNLYVVEHWDVLSKQWGDYQKIYRKTERGRKLGCRSRRKRRLKEKLLKENFTMDDWNKKLEKTNGICPRCNKFIGVNKLTLDHIIPVSKAPSGFIYTINDIQALCKSCNCKKSDKIEKR